jgi:hypothetical protein
MIRLFDPPPLELLEARLRAEGWHEGRYAGERAYLKDEDGFLFVARLAPEVGFLSFSDAPEQHRRGYRRLEAAIAALLEGLPGRLAAGVDLGL